MDILTLFGLIGISIWIFSLQSRIKNLEKNQCKTNTPLHPTPLPNKTTKQNSNAVFPWEEKTSIVTQSPAYKKAKKNFQLEEFFGLKFFSILGSITLIFAIAFL